MDVFCDRGLVLAAEATAGKLLQTALRSRLQTSQQAEHLAAVLKLVSCSCCLLTQNSDAFSTSTRLPVYWKVRSLAKNSVIHLCCGQQH